ncbi:unnamed protein product [Staurois parvus]|uniref:Uncharacterized protein n=1 Tax=Staurois parvus TaxID=386267 RepID=A0ABN9DH11_9NEOB|nr:unnamed protein product [Staurois parvus]
MSSNIHLEDISRTQGSNTPPELCGTPDVQEDRTSVRNISLTQDRKVGFSPV